MTLDEKSEVDEGLDLLESTHRFVARRYSRLLLATCAAVVLTGCLGLVALAIIERRSSAECVLAIGGLLLVGLLPLLLLGETYSFYEVSPQHLELQRWTGRSTRIIWSEVSEIEISTSPMTGFSITVSDLQRSSITLDVEVPDGRRMLGLVRGHLSAAGKDHLLRAVDDAR